MLMCMLCVSTRLCVCVVCRCSFNFYVPDEVGWLKGRSSSTKLSPFLWDIASASSVHLTATGNPKVFFTKTSDVCSDCAIGQERLDDEPHKNYLDRQGRKTSLDYGLRCIQFDIM